MACACLPAPSADALAVLFGDGAGAMVLEARDVPEDQAGTAPGIIASRLHTEGAHNELLYVDGGPSTTGTVGQLRMQGREVFKHAVGMITDVIEAAYEATGLSSEDIDWFVPHQANLRIIKATAQKLDVPMEKVVVTVQDHGNTSAASIPLALSVGKAEGRIKPGDLVVTEAIGGGLAWGSVVLRW